MFKENKTSNKLDILDTFVLSGVLTVLFTRAFLKISGFPTLGSDFLHIAHVLWGGLFLTSAVLLLLLSDKVNKMFAAFLGGVGLGLFIDEVGKFITKDNNYFYEASFMVIYLVFISIWFLSRLILVKTHKVAFLSPAEWPKPLWATKAIYFWAGSQAIIGLVLLIAMISSFQTTEKVVDITGIGLVLGCVYALSLGVGVLRMHQNKLSEAARILRGATLFAILLVYPFVFFEYPFIGTVGVISTVIITIALSKVRLIDLFGNLYLYQIIHRRLKH